MSLFTWPTDDPARALSVVDGERQDAAAHEARGGRLAVDIPAFPTRGVPCPARIPMHDGATARVTVAINDPNASDCGRQLDCWWIWEGVLYEARTCHWDSLDVGVGDMLPSWKFAGVMGASGAAQGVHQHYVLTVNGVVVDPEPYLSANTGDNAAPASGVGQAQNDVTNTVTSGEPIEEFEQLEEPPMQPSIRESLDLIWARLGAIQLAATTQEVIDLAEQCKQEGVVKIKEACGLT